jgi:hypothetical protein
MSSATKRKPATSAPAVSTTSSSVAALAGKIGAPIVSLVPAAGVRLADQRDVVGLTVVLGAAAEHGLDLPWAWSSATRRRSTEVTGKCPFAIIHLERTMRRLQDLRVT